jgi:hypothetical protein
MFYVSKIRYGEEFCKILQRLDVRVPSTYVTLATSISILHPMRDVRCRLPPFSRSASETTQATATAAEKMPGHRQVSRDELRSKTMDLVPAEVSAPADPRLVLRKRLGEEMEALRGILGKAELVVRKTVDKARPAPRCGKGGRFLAAQARSETMEANRIPCDMKRKKMESGFIVCMCGRTDYPER